MNEDELAFKLVQLYVTEVSKGTEKRQMGLDTIMNAYFYALLRIARKKTEMAAVQKAVEKEMSMPAPPAAPPVPGAPEKPPATKAEAFEFE